MTHTQDRRTFLRMMLGIGVVAIAGSAASTSAEAAPVTPEADLPADEAIEIQRRGRGGFRGRAPAGADALDGAVVPGGADAQAGAGVRGGVVHLGGDVAVVWSAAGIATDGAVRFAVASGFGADG